MNKTSLSSAVYTVYQITNIINGKIYIGKHQTFDINDGYMGSGKLLHHAFEKYGKINFQKIILHTFETEIQMNDKEAELVTEDFCKRSDTYNICPGGKGGWGYINSKSEYLTEARLEALSCSKSKDKRMATLKKRFDEDEEYRKKKIELAQALTKKSQEKCPNGAFYGRNHSAETKAKMSMAALAYDRSGDRNGSFGTCWVTNDITSIKIKNEDLVDYLDKGYRKGRVMKKAT